MRLCSCVMRPAFSAVSINSSLVAFGVGVGAGEVGQVAPGSLRAESPASPELAESPTEASADWSAPELVSRVAPASEPPSALAPPSEFDPLGLEPSPPQAATAKPRSAATQLLSTT